MIQKSISLLITIALVLSFNLMFPLSAQAMGNSPLKGLVTLKAMAKEAIPYDMAIANDKPTLLEFYADWCTTCQGMSPTVKNLADKYSDRVNLVMLNIDDPQWNNLVQKYQVTGIPQYTFIDAETKTVDTLIGKVPQTIMAQVFDQVVE
ncbi:MAG: thioredoxin domain-containing protein [Xenococcaceae cyanobacterium MO_188.B19]|nr:thioredoxin domain-containing protein [Xenococcaceae cyanobacterium MO_188.B19]